MCRPSLEHPPQCPLIYWGWQPVWARPSREPCTSPQNSPASAVTIMSCMIWALFTQVVPTLTYLVISRTWLAYPFHASIANCVMYLLLKAALTASTDAAAIVFPRCSTPYLTASSTNLLTLVLASAKVPKNNGLKSSVRKNASSGLAATSAVIKCVLFLWCKLTIYVLLICPWNLLNCH
jgi:hypothetical protein